MLARCINLSRASFVLAVRPMVAHMSSAPAVPQRPTNMYARFVAEHYTKVKAAQPADTPNPEVFREIGRMWSEVSEEDKDDLQAEYDDDMAEYTSAREAFLEEGGDPALLQRPKKAKRVFRDKTKPRRVRPRARPRRARRRARTTLARFPAPPAGAAAAAARDRAPAPAPPQPMSVWTAFVQDFMKDREEGVPVTQAMKDASVAYKSISPDLRASLAQLVEADTARYHREMLAWRAKQEQAESTER